MPYMLRYPPGLDHPLGSEPVWIGNDPTDTINFYDIQILPHMAVIEPEEQGHHITNRGTYVFYVNDTEVPPGYQCQLVDHFEVRIGQSVLTYFWVDDEPVYEYAPASSSSFGWLIIPVLIVVAVILIFLFTGYHFK